jgi:hypothetical protein
MERLKRDIRKFLDHSRIITADQRLWWSQFFERSKVIYQTEILNQSSTWLLDELKLVKSRSYTNDNPNNPAVPLQDTEGGQSVPDKVPDEITDMVNKQFAEIPEVKQISYYLNFFNSFKSTRRSLLCFRIKCDQNFFCVRIGIMHLYFSISFYFYQNLGSNF